MSASRWSLPLDLAHMIPLSAVWAEAGEGTSISTRRRSSSPRPKAPPRSAFSLHVGDVGHTLIVGPDRRRQVGPAGADGPAIPALRRRPDLRLRLRRHRSAPPRSPWVGIGTTSAAPCPTTALSPVSLAAAGAESRTPASRPGPLNGSSTLLARESITITPEVKEHL